MSTANRKLVIIRYKGFENPSISPQQVLAEKTEYGYYLLGNSNPVPLDLAVEVSDVFALSTVMNFLVEYKSYLIMSKKFIEKVIDNLAKNLKKSLEVNHE